MIAAIPWACYGAEMDHLEFKQHRQALGLSVSQAAIVLGVGELQVRRMELAPQNTSARPVNGTMARLIQAYLDGYRPQDWPR
jgi:DNA-binding transcriptional regulator YiaG